MGKRIAIIQGHPSPQQIHLCHALASAYEEGAFAAGHIVRRIEVAQLDFPLLRNAEDWNSGPLPEGLREAAASIGWADHLVLIFPLWTGTMPALFKGFLEQLVRPGFAFNVRPDDHSLMPALTGKSARLVVTMAMPARLFCSSDSHGVRGLQRNILGFCGIKPVRATYIDMVDAKPFPAERWLANVRKLGRNGT